MRSRSAGSAPASSRSIIGSVIGSSLRKRPNSLASSALVPDDQRHPVRLARRASPRPGPAAGNRCRWSGLPRTRRASRAGPSTISRSNAVDQLASAGPPSRRARRPAGPAPSSSANFVAYSAAIVRRADHAGGRALRNRLGEQAFGGGNGQQRGDGVRACALAEDRDVVRDRRRRPRCCRAPSAAPSPGRAGTGCRRR